MPVNYEAGYALEYYWAVNKLAAEYEKFYLSRGVGAFRASDIARRKARKKVNQRWPKITI